MVIRRKNDPCKSQFLTITLIVCPPPAKIAKSHLPVSSASAKSCIIALLSCSVPAVLLRLRQDGITLRKNGLILQVPYAKNQVVIAMHAFLLLLVPLCLSFRLPPNLPRSAIRAQSPLTLHNSKKGDDQDKQKINEGKQNKDRKKKRWWQFTSQSPEKSSSSSSPTSISSTSLTPDSSPFPSDFSTPSSDNGIFTSNNFPNLTSPVLGDSPTDEKFSVVSSSEAKSKNKKRSLVKRILSPRGRFGLAKYTSLVGLFLIFGRPTYFEDKAVSELQGATGPSLRSRGVGDFLGSDTINGNNNMNNNRPQSFISDAVKIVGPAVVRINTETATGGVDSDPFKSFYFGGDDMSNAPRVGTGSGFIFSSNGNVLTNAHVVKDADKVFVTLTDGRRFKAVVKGVDDLMDLAVVKIENEDGSNFNINSGNFETAGKKVLPTAKLGDSDSMNVGEWVIAIGNPEGLDNTVTVGIVSSLKRTIEEVAGVMAPFKKISFIQTDAAINPGNSGGPLVNDRGEVIGINTCIRANLEGVGFAIPTNNVKMVLDDLCDGKSIPHPYIGVQMSDMTPNMAKRANTNKSKWDPNAHVSGVPEVWGAIVLRVMEDGPAAKGGIRMGDVIVEIAGKKIFTSKDAQEMVDMCDTKCKLEVKVIRGKDRTLTVSITPGDMSLLKRGKKVKQ